MFEKTLADQLKRIFKMPKMTYDRPSESQEQEAVFIEISNARIRIKDSRQHARVAGTLHVFASSGQLPYGYFAKCIAAADPADTAGLFFFNLEENKGTFRNIVERSLEFVYFFDSQYDPAVGTINEVNLSIVES